MLNALIQAALHNRFKVIVGTLFVAGLGVYSALNLPIDAIPDLTNVQVQEHPEQEHRDDQGK